MKYVVRNAPTATCPYPYAVIRDCTNLPEPHTGYYYWGAYKTIERAQEACSILGNGLIIEGKDLVGVPLKGER